jgi:transcriptional regulator with GAF, ATPase, and Fis domain
VETASDKRFETASDSRYDARFDSDFATNLLINLAQERSLDGLMEKLMGACTTLPEFARAEFWLIEKGDICSRCPQRAQCPDQTRCLHLVAGCDNPAPGSGRKASCFYRSDERIPLGVGIIGRIATTGKQTEMQDLDKDLGELSSPESRRLLTRLKTPALDKDLNEQTGIEWLRAEQTRGFAVTPISFQGEILGAIAVLTRINAPKEGRVWRQIFADHIGGAIANARAFEEIQKLKAELERQNAYLKEEVIEAKAFGDLVGQSAALRQISSQIDLVAPTDASVLILGETGTGKELVAHEIHRRSRRNDKPFIRVNCASIPKDLYESEFFGHARGAFTGAVKDRVGRFESAERGTIFLDEIGEVPLELQSKLLRVLQEKSYERVGEDRTRHADVRIIAATNRDLKREAAAGRFREDLYYRLNVFPIQVAPLRERREDIPLLAQHFINLSVKEMGCAKPRLTRAGVIRLQSYDWPGNIRELRNVIERAVILARGGMLNFDLQAAEAALVPSRRAARAAGDTEPEFLTEAELQRRERENLLIILERANWKIKGADGAAELLGVNSATLLSRMKKMGLKRAT